MLKYVRVIYRILYYGRRRFCACDDIVYDAERLQQSVAVTSGQVRGTRPLPDAAFIDWIHRTAGGTVVSGGEIG